MARAFYTEKDLTGREVIKHTASDLNVLVYNLEDEAEIGNLRLERTTFYGLSNGCNYAFQIPSDQKDKYYLALYAISWFATTRNKPKMRIIEDSRMPVG